MQSSCEELKLEAWLAGRGRADVEARCAQVFFLPPCSSRFIQYLLQSGSFFVSFGHACGIFVPQPGIIPRTGVVRVLSLTTGCRIPKIVIFLSLNKQKREGDVPLIHKISSLSWLMKRAHNAVSSLSYLQGRAAMLLETWECGVDLAPLSLPSVSGKIRWRARGWGGKA